jgi:D-glycero-alpha-D-manno-heptose-7-phosphate kinase
MLISTAPLRISLAGGGTDLVEYASRHGGAVVGAATDLAVTVVRHRPPAGPRIRACLDRCDHTDNPSAVTNPFARAALLRHWDGEPVHVASFGEAAPGTGIGSSAAFCVALVAALDGAGGDDLDPRGVAERAGAIETVALGRPVGKQDHYLSALGGFQLLRFERDGTVHTEPVPVPPEVRDRLDEELLLFFTGTTRDAGTVLAGQHKAVRNGDRDVTDRLHDIKSLTGAMLDALRSGNLPEIGRLLDRHWRLKQGLSPAVSTPTVDAAYRDALDAGATGGKLAGAGGGGHLLLHVPVGRRADVVAALARHGATRVPVRLGGPGVRTVRLPLPTDSQA